MISINLSHNKKYRNWFRSGGVSVLGKAFLSSTLLEEDAFVQYFSEVTNESSFKEKLLALNGQFAVVIERKDKVFAGTDIIGSFPLFIMKKGDEIKISDHIDPTGSTWNAGQAGYFRKLWYALENETLLVEWKRLVAADYAVFDRSNNVYELGMYYPHIELRCRNTRSVYAEELKKRELDLVNKIKVYVGGRPILLSLSGGYDSRYLLALLAENQVENLTCFTYGKKGGFEVQTALKVSEKLKVKCHFIEYNSDLLNAFFSDEWNQFAQSAHHFSSLPQEQDFFCLHYMKENNLLPTGAVVINGYCQDGTSGIMISPERNFDLKDFIWHKYHIHFRSDKYENSWDGFNSWFVRNRMSKYSIGTINAYEFFGLDFYLPFLDIEWLKYWYALPLEELTEQKFYREYLFDGIFKKFDISIKKPFFDDVDRLQPLKKKVKKLLPVALTKSIQTLNRKKENRDANNALYLYQAIYNRMDVKPPVKDFNLSNVHALYFLQKLRKKYLF